MPYFLLVFLFAGIASAQNEMRTSAISLFHERTEEDFTGNSISGTFGLSPRHAIITRFYRSQEDGDENTDEDESNESSIFGSYISNSGNWEFLLGVNNQKQPGGLKGRGAMIQIGYLLSSNWDGKYQTLVSLTESRNQYDSNESQDRNLGTLVFDSKFKQTGRGINLEQDLSTWARLNLGYTSYEYKDDSIASFNSQFNALNFSRGVSGVSDYPDEIFQVSLDLFLLDNLDLLLSYDDTKSNVETFDSFAYAGSLVFHFNPSFDLELSYSSTKTDDNSSSSDGSFELFGLGASYYFQL